MLACCPTSVACRIANLSPSSMTTHGAAKITTSAHSFIDSGTSEKKVPPSVVYMATRCRPREAVAAASSVGLESARPERRERVSERA